MVLPVPRYLHHLILDVLSQALLQGLSNHGDLVPSQGGNKEKHVEQDKEKGRP